MPSVYTFNALVRTAVLYARGLANNWFCRVLSVGTVESLARHRQPDNPTTRQPAGCRAADRYGKSPFRFWNTSVVTRVPQCARTGIRRVFREPGESLRRNDRPRPFT